MTEEVAYVRVFGLPPDSDEASIAAFVSAHTQVRIANIVLAKDANGASDAWCWIRFGSTEDESAAAMAELLTGGVRVETMH
jgi:hypothetical protein